MVRGAWGNFRKSGVVLPLASSGCVLSLSESLQTLILNLKNGARKEQL